MTMSGVDQRDRQTVGERVREDLEYWLLRNDVGCQQKNAARRRELTALRSDLARAIAYIRELEQRTRS